MDLGGDMPVTLIIKAPNQRLEDQTVSCMRDWTIRKLKQHLEAVYPSKPKHDEQRLIYSGKLLQDHLTLKEILHKFEEAEKETIHTVHLVCSKTNTPTFTQQKTPTVAKENLTTSSQEPKTTTSSSSQSVQSDGLRQRNVSTSSNFQQSSMAPPFENMNHMYSQMTPEQYTLMAQQHMYSQYMAQYMQYYQMYYQGQGINANVFPHSGIPSPNVAQAQAINPAHEPAAPPVAPVQNNAPVRAPNVRMNAQGGIEEDDDGEQRDWLHHTYFFMRFITFMGILYFYSSLTRFLLVFAGSFLVYFLQKWRKNMQRNAQEQEDAQRNQEQQNEAEEVAENTERNTENVEEETNNEGEDPIAEVEQRQPEERNRLSRIVLFIATTVQMFFTSLLPNPPELLEAN